jgi:hypothetical protein
MADSVVYIYMTFWFQNPSSCQLLIIQHGHQQP